MVMLMSCTHCGKGFINWYELMEHQLIICPVHKNQLLDNKIAKEVTKQIKEKENENADNR